jgi:hypothetical protein
VFEPVRRELSRLVPVEAYNIGNKHFDWHQKGGFPVPEDKQALIGMPGNPKGLNDIVGEIFEIHNGDQIICCAYDCSDYQIISTDILSQVDLYFKCTAPTGQLPSNVVKAGYFAQSTGLLAKAREKVLKSQPKKKVDVYGRFGSWTDSQSFRQTLVDNLCNSTLNFTGGFTLRIYPAYLRELMTARIALDAPGQAPLSCRLVETMALGVLVVSRKQICAFPEEMIDGVHYIAIKDDGSNVVEICKELLDDKDRMESIVSQAMIFFDLNFSPQSIARRILRQALGYTR